METFIYETIFVFFLVSWIIFELHIIDVIIDAKPQTNNILWKIIISSMFLGVCAFLSGIFLGLLR